MHLHMFSCLGSIKLNLSRWGDVRRLQPAWDSARDSHRLFSSAACQSGFVAPRRCRSYAPWMQNDLMAKQCRARNAPYGLANKVMNGIFIGVDFHLSSIMWTFQDGTGRELRQTGALRGRLATSATSANRASCYGSQSLALKLAMLKGSSWQIRRDKMSPYDKFWKDNKLFSHTGRQTICNVSSGVTSSRCNRTEKAGLTKKRSCHQVVQVHCDYSYWGSGSAILCYDLCEQLYILEADTFCALLAQQCRTDE